MNSLDAVSKAVVVWAVLHDLRSLWCWCMMVARSHSSIKGSLLRDGMLLLIIKLAGWPIDVDVSLSTGVLIALYGAVLSFPAELLCIVGM